MLSMLQTCAQSVQLWGTLTLSWPQPEPLIILRAQRLLCSNTGSLLLQGSLFIRKERKLRVDHNMSMWDHGVMHTR